MKKLMLIFVVFMISKAALSQGLMNKPSLYLKAGLIDFTSSYLYNPNNNNDRLSYFSQLGFQAPVHTWISPYMDFAYGSLRNMSNDFLPETGSDFLGIGIGLNFHTNQKVGFINKAKGLEPYMVVGYNFERIFSNSDANFNTVITSLRVSGGFWWKVSASSAIGYRFGLNQRLGQDYRTYFTHTFGVLANLPFEPKKRVIIAGE